MQRFLEKRQKKMEEREEELRIEGQMKIEDILMEWEAKQKVNAERSQSKKHPMKNDLEKREKHWKPAERQKDLRQRDAR